MQCKLFSRASSATRTKNMETDISDFDHVKPCCLAAANAKFVFFLHHVATGFECLVLLWAFLPSHMQTTKICVKMLFGDRAVAKHHLIPVFRATWRRGWSQIPFLQAQAVFVPGHTFASSLWGWWCLTRGFPHSRHCHRCPDSAARTGWKSLADPNWCPRTGLSSWKRHCGKENRFIHL